MRQILDRITYQRIWSMGLFRKAAKFTLSSIALVGLTGASLTDYSRVACLVDQQQLPVYRLVSSYAYTEDNPETPKDERKFIEHEYESSTVVFRPGYILTTAHSVKGRYDSIVVKTPLGDREAVRIASDPVNDMALLEMDTTGLQMLPISPGPLKIGQRLWNVGYPLGDGPVSYEGALLSIRGGSLVIGAPAFPGMSGGAAVTCRENRPVLAGIIKSFNLRVLSMKTETKDGRTLIYSREINTGTSNSTGFMQLLWFTEFAIAIQEELSSTREQEQE